jgi:hypothetical protein
VKPIHGNNCIVTIRLHDTTYITRMLLKPDKTSKYIPAHFFTILLLRMLEYIRSAPDFSNKLPILNEKGNFIYDKFC